MTSELICRASREDPVPANDLNFGPAVPALSKSDGASSQLNSATVPKMDYVDAMRGFAILAVIFVHVSQVIGKNPMFQNHWVLKVAGFGQFGVQLFFVASAITLCHSMEHRGTDTAALKAFFFRRLFRIAPMYYLGICLFWGLHAVGIWGKPEWYSGFNLLMNFLLLHGLVPSAYNFVVPGGWSIGTEILFYALFPILFLRYRNSGWTTVIKDLFLFLTVLISVCGFLFQNFQFKIENNSFEYCNVLVQLPVFLIGIACYKRKKLGGTNSKKLQFLASVVSFSMGIGIWFSDSWISYVLVPIIFGTGFGFLSLLMEGPKNYPRWLLEIGRNSYSMYVLHFLFAYGVSFLLFKAFFFSLNPLISLMILYFESVILAFLGAKLTNKFIERPFISMGSVFVEKYFVRRMGE